MSLPNSVPEYRDNTVTVIAELPPCPTWCTTPHDVNHQTDHRRQVSPAILLMLGEWTEQRRIKRSTTTIHVYDVELTPSQVQALIEQLAHSITLVEADAA